MQNNQLISIEAIKQHVFGGSIIFTVHNTDADTHFTYKVIKAKKSDVYWVHVLTMKDNMNKKSYKFIGAVSEAEGYKYSADSYIKEQSKSNQVAIWFFKWLFNGYLIEKYPGVKVYKSSFCSRCTRLLTVPESIIRGMGDCCFATSS